MRTFLITANDTDAGKTHVAGLLARYFVEQALTVQVIKAVACRGSGDEETILQIADSPLASGYTLIRCPVPMAPMADENKQAEIVTLEKVVDALKALPPTDIRLIEGAGGVAVPIDPSGKDWRDLAYSIALNGVITVVDDRLGAINQGRLLHAYLDDLPHAFILNAIRPVDPAIHTSNKAAFAAAGMALMGCVKTNGNYIDFKDTSLFDKAATNPLPDNFYQQRLETRKRKDAFRSLQARGADSPLVNLCDNDYLNLRQHPKIIEAAKAAIDQWGTSSSASPLITGYTAAHAALEEIVSEWYNNQPALVWNSGYAANQAILKLFIQPNDLVVADRLIHNSIINGGLQRGARLIRLPHNDLDQLEAMIQQHTGRNVHLITESVYSMDGDYPNLKRIAELKREYRFTWFLDEAHAVGWYGPSGAGLAEAEGVLKDVDILTGTLGKALASSGAYTVFGESWRRDYCINEAGEFIYSTYLPPSSAAAAQAAIRIVQTTSDRSKWQQQAKQFRETLQQQGWETRGTDSPIVPLICGSSQAALQLRDSAQAAGFQVAAIRPPTVPEGTARLRLSLKTSFDESLYQQLLDHLKAGAPSHA